MESTDTSPAATAFHDEVRGTFGVLPNFFQSAAAAPGLIEQLWKFARSAYIDNPLPSLFKERLFVYLSQFCPVRYCIVRHVGFLIGLGRPAGDPAVTPQTVDEVVTLLNRPRPDLARFREAVDHLRRLDGAGDIPPPGSALEQDLFDVATLLFLTPLASLQTREAVGTAIGAANREFLVAFLAFIRAAHYWTETHPEIDYEPDALKMLDNHPALARLLLQQPPSIAR